MRRANALRIFFGAADPKPNNVQPLVGFDAPSGVSIARTACPGQVVCVKRRVSGVFSTPDHAFFRFQGERLRSAFFLVPVVPSRTMPNLWLDSMRRQAYPLRGRRALGRSSASNDASAAFFRPPTTPFFDFKESGCAPPSFWCR